MRGRRSDRGGASSTVIAGGRSRGLGLGLGWGLVGEREGEEVVVGRAWMVRSMRVWCRDREVAAA